MKSLSHIIKENINDCGAESVKTRIDVPALLVLLNKAYCEEKLAANQYEIVCGLMQGKSRTNLEQEFGVHVYEELDHARMVKERIIELGGVPTLSPMEWNEIADCKYAMPVEPFDTVKLVAQNVEAEKCAIKRYENLIDFCGDRDPVTRRMCENILKDEQKHLQDLSDFERDWVQAIGQ